MCLMSMRGYVPGALYLYDNCYGNKILKISIMSNRYKRTKENAPTKYVGETKNQLRHGKMCHQYAFI